MNPGSPSIDVTAPPPRRSGDVDLSLYRHACYGCRDFIPADQFKAGNCSTCSSRRYVVGKKKARALAKKWKRHRRALKT